MTEIEAKALALVNEVRCERGIVVYSITDLRQVTIFDALTRAIEQHEAFRQEVSDALLAFYGGYHNASGEDLARFIIAKPDPLVEVLAEISGEGGYDNYGHYAYRLRSALEARGLKIVEVGHD